MRNVAPVVMWRRGFEDDARSGKANFERHITRALQGAKEVHLRGLIPIVLEPFRY